MEVQSVQIELDKAEAETSALTIKESEDASSLSDMQRKLKMLKVSIQEKEDQTLLQENAYSRMAAEYDQIVSDKKNQGERKISFAKSDLLLIEKARDDLICTHPQRADEQTKELNALKSKHAEEIQIAQGKVAAMLDKKNVMIEHASLRLASLQRDIAELERQTDEARSRKILKAYVP